MKKDRPEDVAVGDLSAAVEWRDAERQSLENELRALVDKPLSKQQRHCHLTSEIRHLKKLGRVKHALETGTLSVS